MKLNLSNTTRKIANSCSTLGCKRRESKRFERRKVGSPRVALERIPIWWRRVEPVPRKVTIGGSQEVIFSLEVAFRITPSNCCPDSHSVILLKFWIESHQWTPPAKPNIVFFIFTPFLLSHLTMFWTVSVFNVLTFDYPIFWLLYLLPLCYFYGIHSPALSFE